MLRTIKLPSSQVITKDKDGFEKAYTNFLTGIKADFTDCTRNDAVIALQGGYTAEQNVEIFKGNYSGQAYLIDELTNEKWYVERSFLGNKKNYIILTCSRRKKNEYRS